MALRYAAVIFGALIVLSVVAVASIDRTMRAALDGRLRSEAVAASSIIDVRHGNVVVDADDRAQFYSLVETGDQSVVADRNGRIGLSSASHPPANVVALMRKGPGTYETGAADARVRAVVVPIARDGVRAGTLIVWRRSDFIEDAGRRAAFAFLWTAVVLAALALVAGVLVTRGALHDAFERQRRFSADASHELRAPLAVIRAETDLALRKEREPQAYSAALATIAAEADRMEAIVAGLLAAARSQSSTIAGESDATLVVRDAAARLQSPAQLRGIEIAIRGLQRAFVKCSRTELESAVLAILHNAVKAARARVTVVVERHGRWTDILVMDDGAGFSRDALEHAMERFWREEAARAAAGSGLGLAIARATVKAAGGEVTLGNIAEGGAQVTLRLPSCTPASLDA